MNSILKSMAFNLKYLNISSIQQVKIDNQLTADSMNILRDSFSESNYIELDINCTNFFYHS